jgi:CMP-N-acetylneuraminic acid synthetase
MKTACYIQARGGSKRIPGKNKHLWHGVPFVADAIHKAQESELFDLILVSSDDTEILDIARQHGALPVLRSAEMSGDNVTDAELAAEVLRPLKRFDIVCKLYPCVPLLTAEDLRLAWVQFSCHVTDALRAVDADGNDAGAFWMFWNEGKPLDKMSVIDYTLPIAQDINTYADIKEAERKWKQQNTGRQTATDI